MVKMVKKSSALLSIFVCCSLLVSVLVVVDAAAAPTVEKQCSSEFTKVVACLGFASGKVAKPSDECCTSVKDIRSRNPVCLCFIIEKTHEGQATLKQMGVQEAMLLLLPTACNMVDANFTKCPKLLNLAPDSSSSNLFKNLTSAGGITQAITTATSPTLKSDAIIYGPPRISISTFVAIAITVFISTGLMSIFS
ncbi:hypothetical protein GIB67_009357 [Kingdonia uniflora]|uniref:Bifunctional inhibitor/plant lipid transfer protein/seed storage helical domain-containing protein n=1 Tax=Kingdonia uniflora TaxID=39325 RepID=A0A7J7N3J7_9MAGN|nr:hypothetical protein GIB67_009357 [Kingdonia uniflora]